MQSEDKCIEEDAQWKENAQREREMSKLEEKEITFHEMSYNCGR